jgi:hypothetical protein
MYLQSILLYLSFPTLILISYYTIVFALKRLEKKGVSEE